MPENYLSSLKTKLRNTYEKYSKILVPYKYMKIIDQLSRKKDLCILKQDKRRGVVLMDKTKYTNKYLEIFETNQFIKTMILQNQLKERYNDYWEILNLDCRRKSIAERVLLFIPKYLTGSCTENFYWMVKIHKVPPDGNLSNLPLRPTISNISTTSYQTAKYLAQLLSHATRSEYIVNSTRDLTVKSEIWFYLT